MSQGPVAMSACRWSGVTHSCEVWERCVTTREVTGRLLVVITTVFTPRTRHHTLLHGHGMCCVSCQAVLGVTVAGTAGVLQRLVASMPLHIE